MLTIYFENGLKIARVKTTITFNQLEDLFKIYRWDYLIITD